MPPPVRSDITLSRRCCAFLWLRGENLAVAISFFLQPLF
jgi:hypothetical protein